MSERIFIIIELIIILNPKNYNPKILTTLTLNEPLKINDSSYKIFTSCNWLYFINLLRFSAAEKKLLTTTWFLFNLIAVHFAL